MRVNVGIITVILLLLSACSTQDIETSSKLAEVENEKVEKSEEENDIIYKVGWSDDKSGVITTIDHVVIEEQEDTLNGETFNALFVHFKIQNTADEPLTTYPNQGKLVIGETQISADMLGSDDIGGELLNEVTKEGYIAFALPENIKADALGEIRLVWSHYADLLNDNKYDVTLKLSKLTP
ncbi:DUF4352 domain-containing protein [Cytobacillus massiliigabonensis]|uniref:DUF4352 domain-containing protein n=1 Tax=Cytobacillus massiliigabonensis TaxID=1871011 RepID=UPI000C824703|nr:DUF4352 domain-containing protein [Cytobacillus massiliigabonensis]